MTRSSPRSDALFARAVQLMPGGVNSPVRAFRSVGGTPLYFQEASGARFVDVDGRSYVDFCMSWGPLVLGHAHPAVVAAVQRAASLGLSYGACCAGEVELAERILGAFPGLGRIRFVSTGTEAVMTAVRLARGFTGRPMILKFEGCYHGHSDSMLVKAGSGLATFGLSSSAGVPEELARQTLVLPLGDDEALEIAFREHGSKLAAAIVEPLPANNGLLEQRPEWLRKLRELCSASGALLVFDEVISGFRCRFGGYGQGLGIESDLVTLGKIVGGGLPVGAVAGRTEIMGHLAPDGSVYQAGTLSGNPVALAAGIATLDLLADGEAYARLEALGRHFDREMSARVRGRAWLKWRRVGSIVWFHLDEGPIPRRADQVRPEAVARFNGMYDGLLEAGLYVPPSAYEVLFLSTAHDEADVTALATAVDRLLA
jgi:glutamate-1-semialdehyde 2,1-aminomutase